MAKILTECLKLKKKKLEVDKETRKALNVLAREQLKHRLLADLAIDINICNLEGWDYKEYLKELQEIINHFLKET